MANMKEDMAFLMLMPEVDKITREGVVYKTGISEHEVKSKLLDQMFVELNGKVDVVNLDEENDDNPQETEDPNPLVPVKNRPPGWFFQDGFVLYIWSICK
jgi:hypothetical protein